MPDVQAPPIGIKPEKIWITQRVQDIAAAIQRYEEMKYPVPADWLDELARHTDTIKDMSGS